MNTKKKYRAFGYSGKHMKKLLIVAAIALPVLVKAQDTIKVPTRAAKQVVRDLIACDSAKAELELTKEQLVLTEAKLDIKEAMVGVLQSKVETCKDEVQVEKQKAEVWENVTKDLQKQNKKLKAKLTFTKIVAGAIIVALTYLGITK
jgi:hypothetical protein